MKISTDLSIDLRKIVTKQHLKEEGWKAWVWRADRISLSGPHRMSIGAENLGDIHYILHYPEALDHPIKQGLEGYYGTQEKGYIYFKGITAPEDWNDHRPLLARFFLTLINHG